MRQPTIRLIDFDLGRTTIQKVGRQAEFIREKILKRKVRRAEKLKRSKKSK